MPIMDRTYGRSGYVRHNRDTSEIDDGVKSIDGSGVVTYNRTRFLPRNSYVAEQFRKSR